MLDCELHFQRHMPAVGIDGPDVPPPRTRCCSGNGLGSMLIGMSFARERPAHVHAAHAAVGREDPGPTAPIRGPISSKARHPASHETYGLVMTDPERPMTDGRFRLSRRI